MKNNHVSAISLFSYPKVNLALDILGKTDSGYHEIQTVYHQLSSPADEIILEDDKSGAITVLCNHPKVPTDEKNTAFKAALLLKKHFGISRGVKITIDKKIPVMSGLGGGASNAVATLKGLAKLWGISDKEVLEKIALQIGMDCSFFFYGDTALGEHFGEKITPLPPLPPEIKFEIIETGVEISSYWAYGQIEVERCGKDQEKTNKLIESLRKKDAKGILKNLHNDFEEFIFKKFHHLPSTIYHLPTHLTGSGGCLFRAYL